MKIMKRKNLIIIRHGVKQKGKGKGNLLRPSSIQSLYDKGRELRGVVSTDPDKAFIMHSDEARTLRTVKALSNGIYLLDPEISTNNGLNNLTGIPTNIREDPNLSYGPDFKFNETAYVEHGNACYLDNWMRNPKATTYEGVEITPFSDMLRKSKSALKENIGLLINGLTKNLGTLSSHGGLVEAMTAAAVGSRKPRTVIELEEIGGDFNMEDHAIVEVDYDPEGIITPEARLRRGDQVYAMSLTNLFNN